jgi:hypothetical protein
LFDKAQRFEHQGNYLIKIYVTQFMEKFSTSSSGISPPFFLKGDTATDLGILLHFSYIKKRTGAVSLWGISCSIVKVASSPVRLD